MEVQNAMTQVQEIMYSHGTYLDCEGNTLVNPRNGARYTFIGTDKLAGVDVDIEGNTTGVSFLYKLTDFKSFNEWLYEAFDDDNVDELKYVMNHKNKIK